MRQISLLFIVLSTFHCTTTQAQFNRRNNKSSNAYHGNYQRFGVGPTARHSFEIKNGVLWGWGANGSGQLGDGTTRDRTIPVQIGTASNWVNIAGGFHFSLGLRSDGTLWGSGGNGYGQLGEAPSSIHTSPKQIGTDNNWVGIAAGGGHSLAIKNDGTLWAWGRNDQGQLGDGTNIQRNTPVQIGNENKWVSVSAGMYFSLALKSDGTMWAWGENLFGQVGDGTYSTLRYSPVQIGTDSKWVSIAAGGDHGMALKSNGTIWMWGANFHGELGDGTTEQRTIPVQVGNANDWVNIGSGFSHALAVKSDGSLWGWGHNSDGQLGDGTTAGKTTPVRIGTEHTWVVAGAGYNHSLGLKSNGSLSTWGANFFGQIGDGTTAKKLTPWKISSSLEWLKIAGGLNHAIALKSDGTLWGWGGNSNGELGDGSNKNKYTPIQIGSASDWVSVSSGVGHSAALKSNGTLWGWGRNDQGQVGNGTTDNQYLPVQIGTGANWVSVATGFDHTLAIKADGTLCAWGNNFFGQLGDGSTIGKTAPIEIGSDKDWVSVSAGEHFTIALKSNGTAWGWGSNEHGKNGTSNERHLPFQIGTDNSWTSVYTGGQFALALKSKGTMWGWGESTYGQLGGFTSMSTPNQFSTENDWLAVGGGNRHCVAIKSDGLFWAWGDNTFGQIGDLSNRLAYQRVQIAGQENIVSLVQGTTNNFSATLSSNRNNFCFTGQGTSGQFGNGVLANSSLYTCTNNICLAYSLESDNAVYAQSVGGTGSRSDFQKSCKLSLTVVPSGSNPVTGELKDSVWIEPSVPTTAGGQPYVQRHYGITPQDNAANATATITLYFSQDDFTAYNAMAYHGPDLPIDALDALNNKANVRVLKKSGTSNNGTGLFETYSGGGQDIVPTSVMWNASINAWAVTLNVTGFSGFFITSGTSVILPVKLLDFTARLQGSNGVLSWKIANEDDLSSYEIERSTDGRSFANIVSIKASAFAANNRYDFTDKNIGTLGLPVVYYRLKLVNNDRTMSYSIVVPLNISSKQAIVTMYPIPVRESGTLSISASKAEILRYKIVDASGRVLTERTVQITAGMNNLPFDTYTLASGTYTLQLRGGETSKDLRFIKH